MGFPTKGTDRGRGDEYYFESARVAYIYQLDNSLAKERDALLENIRKLRIGTTAIERDTRKIS